MNYRQRFFLALFCMAVTSLICGSSRAETIRLKNGRIFDAAIVEENRDEIKVVMKSGGVVTFTTDEIDTIDGRKLTPPPAKKSVAKPKAVVKTTTVAAKPAPKKAQKPAPPVKKKPVQTKPAPVEAVPVAAVTASTFTNFTASTVTIPVPSASRSPLSLPAIIFAVIVLAVVAVGIFFLIKRGKNKDNKNEEPKL